ncbi:MAG: hypothetical protein ACJ8F7_11565 [Gemmataceae bacterium]
MKQPQVMGLVFCERLNPLTFSLERLFQGRRFRRFPTQPHDFEVYSALCSDNFEGRLELVVTRLETEEDVYRHRQWCRSPGGFVLQLQVPIHKIRFTAPGRYQFRLLFEGKELTGRFLDISREEGR